MGRKHKACKYYATYTAKFPPKCNCRPCWLFWKASEKTKQFQYKGFKMGGRDA